MICRVITLNLILLFAAVSCTCKRVESEIEEVFTKPVDSLTLERSGSLSWALDEQSVPQIKSSFFDAEAEILYVFNEITWELDSYCITTGERIKGQKMRIRPWSMNIVSADSIYVLDLDHSRIVRLNASGKVVDSVNIEERSTILPGGTGQPYIISDNLLAYVSSHTRLQQTSFVVDARTSEMDSYLKYPEIFEDFYGVMLMQVPYSAYNPQEKRLIVGFAPESCVYVLDMDTRSIERFHTESVFYREIKPLRKGRWGYGVSSSEEIEYFRANTTYANILYDEYRNLYYRIVEIATPMPGVTLTNKAKKLSVIIMDAGFKKIGESVIEDNVISSFRYTCFVSEDGLNLQLLTSEDEMSFTTYKIVAE